MSTKNSEHIFVTRSRATKTPTASSIGRKTHSNKCRRERFPKSRQKPSKLFPANNLREELPNPLTDWWSRNSSAGEKDHSLSASSSSCADALPYLVVKERCGSTRDQYCTSPVSVIRTFDPG